ncbi:MAG: endonuclease/exonuclease/phosphatase family protein [Candidatus Rhabdochlamydia sp.]
MKFILKYTFILGFSAILHGEIENKIPIVQQTRSSDITGFSENISDELIYLPGACVEKEESVINLHILNFESCLKVPASLLAEFILSQDADVICIQDMDTHYAHDLYELLLGSYAHFLYMNPSSKKHAASSFDGFFIASKYPMENAQFNSFKDPEKEGEGYLDFIIKNKNTPIGHIYLTHLQKDPETQTLKFLEAVEKMKLDFLNTKEQIPSFVLCGKLSLLEDSEEDFFFLSDSQRDFTEMESLTLTSIQAIEDDNLPFASKQETSYSLNSSLYSKEL